MKENLFANAIMNNELLNFAQGRGEYFIQDREYNEHWVLGSWLNHIIPFYKKDKKTCIKGIKAMFMELLNVEENPEIKMEYLLYHLYVCYYLIYEENIDDISKLMEEIEPYIIDKIKILKRLLPSEKLQEVNRSITMIKNKGGLKSYKTLQ